MKNRQSKIANRKSTKSWTQSVREIVLTLPNVFTTQDVYKHERKLQRAHPENKNVRAKIRQQLQVLRDKGLLIQGKPVNSAFVDTSVRGYWTRNPRWKSIVQ